MEMVVITSRILCADPRVFSPFAPSSFLPSWSLCPQTGLGYCGKILGTPIPPIHLHRSVTEIAHWLPVSSLCVMAKRAWRGSWQVTPVPEAAWLQVRLD